MARHRLAPREQWAMAYEAGIDCGLRKPPLPADLTLWQGEPLGTRSLAVWAEDGLGDFLRHCRHLARLDDQASDIVLVAPEKMRDLLAANFPAYRMVSNPADALGADRHIMSGSLDGLFWSVPDNIQPSGYLVPPRPAGRQPGAANSIHIGVCTRSLKRSDDRDINYAPLDALAPVFGAHEYQCHALQYDKNAEELAAAHRRFANPVVTYPDEDFFHDIDSLACRIAAMDMVIASSTLVADLASALGVETIRFHGVPGVSLADALSGTHDTGVTRPGDRCWYGDRTTIYYRGEHDTWEDFFRFVARRLPDHLPHRATRQP
ncbi:MAG: hypothetical protein EP335_01455 [Alphaproteobacteria bacterium]|nr:MAG: hypothetical protein EP335_01455 [Alphaproteobacteria bacterium]